MQEVSDAKEFWGGVLAVYLGVVGVSVLVAGFGNLRYEFLLRKSRKRGEGLAPGTPAHEVWFKDEYSKLAVSQDFCVLVVFLGVGLAFLGAGVFWFFFVR